MMMPPSAPLTAFSSFLLNLFVLFSVYHCSSCNNLKSLISLQNLKYQLVMPSRYSQGCCSIIPNQNILKSIVLTIPKVCVLSITIITIIISTTRPFQKCVPSSIRQRAPSHLLFFQLPIWSSSDWLPSSP